MGSFKLLKDKQQSNSEIRNAKGDFGFIKVINFIFLLIIVLGIPFSNSLIGVFIVLSVFGLGFAALPLYISENLKGTEFSNEAYLYLSSIATFFCLVFMLIFYMRYASQRGSGFSDGDVIYGFLSALFLLNSFFFVFSLVVRFVSGFNIHKIEFLFGGAMLLVGISSVSFVVYLLGKVV